MRSRCRSAATPPHAFGVTATIVKENGKWVYAKATQAEKNKLAFYALLYKEGLLDNEYVTKQWDTMEWSDMRCMRTDG